jgi:hypothetical protein
MMFLRQMSPRKMQRTEGTPVLNIAPANQSGLGNSPGQGRYGQ